MNPRIRLYGIAAVALAGLALSACTDQSAPTDQPTTAAAPPCEGTAVSDYGLGNAVHESITGLADLPTRFSTGTGTVTVDESGALDVMLHLCAPDADLDATKDAASTVAREIATIDTLGTHVASVTIVNPSAPNPSAPNPSAPNSSGAQSIIAKPFDAGMFAGDSDITALRSAWQPTESN